MLIFVFSAKWSLKQWHRVCFGGRGVRVEPAAFSVQSSVSPLRPSLLRGCPPGQDGRAVPSDPGPAERLLREHTDVKDSLAFKHSAKQRM